MSVDMGDNEIARRLDAISDLSKNSRTILLALNLVCVLLLFSISGANFSDKLISLRTPLDKDFEVLVSTKGFDTVVSNSELPGWDWARVKLENFNSRGDTDALVKTILEDGNYSTDLIRAARKLQQSLSNYMSEIEASGTSVVRFKTPFFDQGVSYIHFVPLGALVILAVQAYLLLHTFEYSRRISALRTIFADDSILEYVVFPWSLSFAVFGSTTKKCVFLLVSATLPFATQFLLSVSFTGLYGGLGITLVSIKLLIILTCCIMAPIVSLVPAWVLTNHLGFEVTARKKVRVMLYSFAGLYFAYYMYLAFTL